jgi:hypothetical protein
MFVSFSYFLDFPSNKERDYLHFIKANGPYHETYYNSLYYFNTRLIDAI